LADPQRKPVEFTKKLGMWTISRSVAYAEGSIVNDDGKLVARASGTFFLTETLVQSERERL